jgi:hypothetical protein
MSQDQPWKVNNKRLSKFSPSNNPDSDRVVNQCV